MTAREWNHMIADSCTFLCSVTQPDFLQVCSTAGQKSEFWSVQILSAAREGSVAQNLQSPKLCYISFDWQKNHNIQRYAGLLNGAVQ